MVKAHRELRDKTHRELNGQEDSTYTENFRYSLFKKKGDYPHINKEIACNHIKK